MEISKMSGRTIRAARAVLGWSTADLASRASIGVATLNRFERQDGTYRRATVETATAIHSSIVEGLRAIGWELMDNGGIQPAPKGE